MKETSFFRLQHRYAPYLFVSPFLFLFSVFGVYPIFKSLQLSLYITNGPRDHVFVGLGNFQFLLRDPDFHTAVWNTIVFALCSVFLQLPLSLGLAILLSQKWLKGRAFFRLAFFCPQLVGQAFVAVLFGVLFVPKFGLINQTLFSVFGIPDDTKWLQNPSLVMPALVLTSLWMYVGFNMIYFLAALQGVDLELYEAAKVDGANSRQQFFAVTLPGIRPVAVFVLVTATIGSFQLFELPYILLNNSAGPNKSGLTLVMYLFQTGFVTGDLGYASAVGWTLAIGVLVISLIQMRITGAWKGENA
ncbi:MAG: sugar ABC transporter permease [Armatimonadetes bacterium]|nr:sugar ABC transporter permease [Armatimonadota bacterium]